MSSRDITKIAPQALPAGEHACVCIAHVEHFFFFLKSGGRLALQTVEPTLMCKTFVMRCADDTCSVFSYPVQGVVLSAEL